MDKLGRRVAAASPFAFEVKLYRVYYLVALTFIGFVINSFLKFNYKEFNIRSFLNRSKFGYK